jgi:hypothetical protein
MEIMGIGQRWTELERTPPVRTALFVLGCLMIVAAPLVGIIPGPGGIIVFGFGLGLILKYSDWAKRKYVEFKRRHPSKGAWADWGLRRQSALRRQKRDREELKAQEAAQDD